MQDPAAGGAGLRRARAAAVQAELVALFQESLEVGVLAQEGLDLVESLGNERIEPRLAQVVVDPV